MPPERKYALIKIEAGDYLLPGNDGRTLWRVRRGVEEHIAEDSLGIVTRDVWELWRCSFRLDDDSVADLIQPDEDSQWEHIEAVGDRAQGIKRALELEP